MRLLKDSEIARRAAQSLLTPKDKTLKRRNGKRPIQEHGRQIFIFNHLQKKMVAYSLTRALNNNKTISHLPFNGKKTVPPALRKDLWAPFATINFRRGCGRIGLSVLQKLREYRKRHELEWDDEQMKHPKTGYFIAKKERAQKLCDQIANSVADMAAVLARLNSDQSSTMTKVDEVRQPMSEVVGAKSKTNTTKVATANFVPRAPKGSIGLVGEGSGEQVQILWRDAKNAEFAESWSGNVLHGTLGWNMNYRDNAPRNASSRAVREAREKKQQKWRERMVREGLARQKRARRHEIAERTKARAQRKAATVKRVKHSEAVEGA